MRPCSAMSMISRPASSLSKYRPSTGYKAVFPINDDDNDDNDDDNDDDDKDKDNDNDIPCRPHSSQSVRSSTSAHEQTRPQSRSFPLSRNRPLTAGYERVFSDENVICGPYPRRSGTPASWAVRSDKSAVKQQTRPDSRSSLHSMSSKHKKGEPDAKTTLITGRDNGKYLHNY